MKDTWTALEQLSVSEGSRLIETAVIRGRELEAQLASRDARISELENFVMLAGKWREQMNECLQRSDARIQELEAALKRIAVPDCGCGYPCECYSWRIFADIARAALSPKGGES